MNFIASFGEHTLSKLKPEDITYNLEYSPNGEFALTGDKSGRIVLFKITPPSSKTASPCIQYIAQCRAHQSQFDCVRSEMSDPKIEAIQWFQETSNYPHFLTCDTHNIYLWKLSPSNRTIWSSVSAKNGSLETFIPPRPTQIDICYNFNNIEKYTDTSIECCLDTQILPQQDSFFMLDVSQVLLWDPLKKDDPVTLLSMEDSSPELTSMSTHPFHPFTFFVSDELGMVRCYDLRQQAEILTPALSFGTSFYQPSPDIAGINFMKVLPDGNHILTRSFGDVQIWDIRNTEMPKTRADIQWFGKKMDALHDALITSDVWKCGIGPDGKVYTGKFGNSYVSWDWQNSKLKEYKAVSQKKQSNIPSKFDFVRRITCCNVHPNLPLIGIVSSSALYFYNI